MFALILRALRAAPVAAVAVAASLAALPHAAQAQTTVLVAPGVWATRLPLAVRAPASAAGEAVHFSGVGSVTTRLTADNSTGARSMHALISLSGITGTGVSTGTRYVLAAQESFVLPHATVQTVSFSFALEPSANSANQALRSAQLTLNFVVDLSTGAIAAVNSGAVSVQ